MAAAKNEPGPYIVRVARTTITDMSRLDHFLVVHRCTADAPPLTRDEQRLRSLRQAGRALHVLVRDPLLVAWTGAPPPADQAPFLRIVGNPYNVGTARPADIAAGILEAAGELDGAFAGFALNPALGHCTVVSDRFGLVPLYVHEVDGSLCCSTSLPLLLGLRQPVCRVDPAGVHEMLLLRMVLGNRTLLQEIGLLAPATALRLRTGAPSPAPYWSWQGIGGPRRAEDPLRDLVHETYALIEQMVLRGVPADVSCVAVPLDGGLSSRLLLAVLVRNEVPVQVYARHGMGEDIAREVAHALGVSLCPLRVLDPARSLLLAHEASDCAYHVDQAGSWDIALQAAEEDGCAVLFDGVALDGALGSLLAPCEDAGELARQLESCCAEAGEEELARAIGAHARALFGSVRSSLEAQARDAVAAAGPHAGDYFLMTNCIRKHLFGGCLANLPHLPGRFPFVTTRLFEHCMRLPPELRHEQTLFRELICELFPNLARIRWESTGVPANRSTLAQPGRWQRWMKGVVRRLGGRVSLAARGSFDQVFRTHEPLRQIFLEVLHRDVPGLADILPADLAAQVVGLHLGGRDLGGLLQGLCTVKHFLARFGAPGMAGLDGPDMPRRPPCPVVISP
jgi:hypothetical protein